MNEAELTELAGLMVWGSSEPVTDKVNGRVYQASEPLPAWVAADFMGLKRRRAKIAMSDPSFRKLFATNLEAMRNGERARNLHTAIAIRDEAGEGLAADRTVRLKAIQLLEGTAGGGVTVNVNQTNNSLTVSPGYVIKLRPTEAQPALPPSSAPPMIDVTPQPEAIEQ